MKKRIVVCGAGGFIGAHLVRRLKREGLMVTINGLALMIAEIAGKTISINNIPGPLGVRGRVSDNLLIQEKLGWAPSEPLEEGLRKTYPWIAERVRERKLVTA
jgi:GDP-D-mannose 3',5'-epimerase